MNVIDKLNKKTARQIYLTYYLKSFTLTFWISALFAICTILLGRFLFENTPIWYYCFIALPIIALYVYTHQKCQKQNFTQTELWAFIDVKTNSQGQYLTVNELQSNADISSNTALNWIQNSNTSIKVSPPWETLISYILGIFLFILFVQWLPLTFMHQDSISGKKLAMEQTKLDILNDAKAITEEEKNEIQKEIDRVRKNLEENGVTRENWQDKQRIGSLLDQKADQQKQLQEQMVAQLEELQQNISKNKELEELAKKLQKLESLVMKAPQLDAVQESLSKILQNMPSSMKDSVGKMSEKELSKLMQMAMKELAKEMQACQNGLSAYPKNGQQNSDEQTLSPSDKPIGKKLKDLLEELEKEGFKIAISMSMDGEQYGFENGDSEDSQSSDDVLDESRAHNVDAKGFQNNISNLEELNKGKQLGQGGTTVELTKGQHDEYQIDQEKSNSRDFSNTKTDLINEQKVLPNRRRVIKEYFNRAKEENAN